MAAQATVVMTTVADRSQADALCTLLLERRLAACIQEIPMTSRYRWQGEVQRESEILLLVKTSAGAADDVMQAIEVNHEYDVPEILALPVSGGLPAYLRWLENETGEPR